MASVCWVLRWLPICLGDAIQGVKVVIVIYGLMVIGSSLLNLAPLFLGRGQWQLKCWTPFGNKFYIWALQAGRPQERAIRGRINPVVLWQPKSLHFHWLQAELLGTNLGLILWWWLWGQGRKAKASWLGDGLSIFSFFPLFSISISSLVFPFSVICPRTIYAGFWTGNPGIIFQLFFFLFPTFSFPSWSDIWSSKTFFKKNHPSIIEFTFLSWATCIKKAS